MEKRVLTLELVVEQNTKMVERLDRSMSNIVGFPGWRVDCRGIVDWSRPLDSGSWLMSGDSNPGSQSPLVTALDSPKRE